MPTILRRIFAGASTILISVLSLGPIAQASTFTIVHSQASAKTAKLLQYTSQGHILGFKEDGLIVASARHVLKVDFLGSKGVAPKPDNESSSAGKAQPLSRVVYQNIWNGVTAVYSADKNSVVKSSYYLDDGARASSIRLGYNRPVRLDKQGNLVVSFEDGTLTESAPIAWQEVNGQKKPVTVSYSLHDDREVGFSLDKYISGIPVVIDPDLTWNTFLGGAGANDLGTALAVDASGNVYVVGQGDATWGTPVRAFSTGFDAFVAKLDNNGNLLWNTFLGGSGTDSGAGIVVDGSGNIYVAGSADATWGTPVRAYTSGTDTMAAKLDTNGNLIWNTFLGGAGANDLASAIAIDGSGNIYVSGRGDATWGSPVRAYSAGNDVMAAKLNNSGALVWNTFLGGAGNDRGGNGITVDASGNAYLVGNSSATWGTPVRAYTLGTDGLVIKLDSTGALVWNTFLGGSGTDFINAVTLDGSGNVYVDGSSGATWGTPVRAYSAGNDSDVAKLDNTGVLLWNTFLGGSGSDVPTSLIIIDSLGNLFIGGDSTATWGAPINAFGTSTECYVAKVSPSGSLTWNTFFGGTGADSSRGMAMDSSLNLYFLGIGDVSWGAPVRAHSAGFDAFVAKLSNSLPVASAVSITGTPNIGSTLTGHYTYSDSDADTEGTSTFRWLRNGVAIGGATSITYIPVLADAGTTSTFEVTPVASTGTTPGLAVTSTGVFINSPPVASAVSISGTPDVGSTLTGHYTYSDVDGDIEGTSTFRWLRDGSPISGATSTTYSPADVGSTITFEVTPVASTGSTPGAAVLSSGVVVTGNTPVTSGGGGGGVGGGTGDLSFFNYGTNPPSSNPTNLQNLQNLGIAIHSLLKLESDGNASTQSDSAVYYVGSDGMRHAFPNDKVYFTWYTSFNGVQIVGSAQLASIPLGKNVTYKPGVKLVKFTTDPKVYAVSKNGVLRWVKTEAVAISLYGSNWNYMIDDISDAFYTNYHFGTDINSSSDFSPPAEQASVSYPSDSLEM